MVLTISDLSFNYPGVRTRPQLLDGFNLVLEKGSVTALLGQNGSGKTTLLNILSGFETAYEGTVLINGNELRGAPYERARLKIGRLFQGARLSEDLTLFENLMLAFPNQAGDRLSEALFRRRRLSRREKEGREIAVSVLDSFFGAGNAYVEKLDQKASAFSYGEQRILAFVRLMMGDYELLLLDEPTSGVNPMYVDRIGQSLRQWKNRGVSILMVEHNIGFVRQTADCCAYLEGGKILASGKVESVLLDGRIRSKYLGI